jgi:hypothetical protein
LKQIPSIKFQAPNNTKKNQTRKLQRSCLVGNGTWNFVPALTGEDSLIFTMGTDIIPIRRLTRIEGMEQQQFTPRETRYWQSKGKSAWYFAARFAT